MTTVPSPSAWQRWYARAAVVVGFVLSPLSWWNDPFVNLPLSYAFAVPFGALDRRLFLPLMAVGYWLTNILGLLLLHHGTTVLLSKPGALPLAPRKSLRQALTVSLLYTLVIVLLVQFGIVRFPTEYLRR